MPDMLIKIMRDRYARVSQEENFSRTNFVFGDEQPLGIKYIGVLFKQYAEFAGVPVIRIHDLRHPYVKHTTKKYNSEKQKTQATKIVDLIAWGFCFCIVSYSKRSWTL